MGLETAYWQGEAASSAGGDFGPAGRACPGMPCSTVIGETPEHPMIDVYAIDDPNVCKTYA